MHIVPVSHYLKHLTGRLPLDDLETGRFIKRFAQSEEAGIWVTFRSTGKSTGEWLVWDGKMHAVDNREVDDLLVTAFIDALESAVIPEDKHKAVKARLVVLKSRGGLEAVKARVRAELRVPTDFFDEKSRYIALADGRVLDLGMLHADPMAPSPTRKITRLLGTSLSGESETAWRWLDWLNTRIGTPEEREFLQRTAGAALVGDGAAKNIVHFVGDKDSGKTFYLNVLTGVFGSYAGSLAADALVDKPNNYSQAGAKGIRFLTISEPSTRKADDAFLKSISGSRDLIRTRNIYEGHEAWHAECVPHIAANSVVKFNTGDPAIVDRINIIELPVIPSDEIITDYESQVLDEESDGVLLWVIEGARKYLESGITVPQIVKDRANSNVVEQSAPLRWLAEVTSGEDALARVDTSAPAAHWVLRSDAFDHFSKWCFNNNEDKVTNQKWRNEIHAATGLGRRAEPKSDGFRIYGLVDLGNNWANPINY